MTRYEVKWYGDRTGEECGGSWFCAASDADAVDEVLRFMIEECGAGYSVTLWRVCEGGGREVVGDYHLPF